MDQEEDCICLTDDLIILQKDTQNIIPISKYAHIRKEGKALLNNIPMMDYSGISERYEYHLSENRLRQTWLLDQILVLHRNSDSCLLAHSSWSRQRCRLSL